MPKECKFGKKRNPDTGRCRTVKGEPKRTSTQRKPSTKKKSKGRYHYLYPHHDDDDFNAKISENNQFADTKYKGDIQPVEAHAAILCDAEFELAPHQAFVRNFVSNQTPYNGLLLYHGMGSGKTCSAISIAEETRMYQKRTGNIQRIMVVASPNVQDNFRLQLFDERKLQSVDGFWTMASCTGDRLLDEINPNQTKGLKRKDVVRMVKSLINSSYSFKGYIEFANYIVKREKRLPQLFENRLLIIDEVHNIRLSDDNSDKRVATELGRLVNSVRQMKLILMSGTPMYNSPREIVWLVNLLNINDKRPHPPLEVKDVFDSDGFFKEPDGRSLLERRATGYISFVRGENPYTFPYRIWAKDIDPSCTFQHHPRPRFQLNGAIVPHQLEHLDVYLTQIAQYQQNGYSKVIANLDLEDDIESFNYTVLQRPLEALNIIYPDKRLEDDESEFDSKYLVGKEGLNRLMSHTRVENPPARFGFKYRDDYHGRIFAPDEIGKYSHKIKSICENVSKSDGVSLIYSQYIDGGLVPMALALEEMGFTRAGTTKSLLHTPPDDPQVRHKYVMITGEKGLSPDNLSDLKLVTETVNKDGGHVKVVLVSQAGTEGLDFKFIRQVHILEPWYNMNRIEQIIGRAVRTCSHKDLPFAKRNVEIYLYGTILSDTTVEAADLYLYGVAERKALKIGMVSRLLKECSVDCHINIEQTNFTVEQMEQTVTQDLASGKSIKYQVGDKPYTSVCDYMDECVYKCAGRAVEDVKHFTYSTHFAESNIDPITKRVRLLFKDRFVFRKKTLLQEIRRNKDYSTEQIHVALTKMINNRLVVSDKFGRPGRIVNIGDMYLFEPVDITLPHKSTQTNASLYERMTPVDYKRPHVVIDVNAQVKLSESTDEMLLRLREQFAKLFVEKGGGIDWYKYAVDAIRKLTDIEVEVKTLVVAHIIEELVDDEVLVLLNGLDGASDEFDALAQNYVKNRSYTHGGATAFPLSTNKIFIKRDDEWIDGEPEDCHDFAPQFEARRLLLKKQLSMVVGYLCFENSKQAMIFKSRETDKPRNKGIQCTSLREATRLIKRIDPKAELSQPNRESKKAKLNGKSSCVYLELLLRHRQRENGGENTWFLSPFESKLIGIS